MNILKNKYFILGNILLLLAVVPITLFVIKRQTDLQSNAAPTTTLSFSPTTVNTNVNKNFTLDIYADPGENAVSIIEMTIKVDPTKLQIVSLQKNSTVLPVTLVEPQINGGTVSLTASTSNNVAEAIQEKTKVATLTLKALTTTSGSPTLVTFDQPSSQVFSIASSDGKTENVLNSTESSSVTIAQASTGGGGNGGSGGNSGNGGNGGNGGSGNNGSNGGNGSNGSTGSLQKPICTGLFLDRSAVGTAPYSLVLTASGNQPGGTISKVTFSFGDGVVQEVTQAGGVGTANVNVQISHTYNNAGSYPASVTMTDSSGRISESATCKQTITVSAPVGGGGGSGGAGGSSGSGSGSINTGGNTNQGGSQTGGGATGGSGSVPATGTLETSLAVIGIVGTLVLTGVFFLL